MLFTIWVLAMAMAWISMVRGLTRRPALKTETDVDRMRLTGVLASSVLDRVASLARVGITTAEVCILPPRVVLFTAWFDPGFRSIARRTDSLCRN